MVRGERSAWVTWATPGIYDVKLVETQKSLRSRVTTVMSWTRRWRTDQGALEVPGVSPSNGGAPCSGGSGLGSVVIELDDFTNTRDGEAAPNRGR